MSKSNSKHLQLVRSSEYATGSSTQPKLPQADDLLYGELALNFKKGVETLSIKNSENEIVTFPNNNDIEVLTSAYTKHNTSLGFNQFGEYKPSTSDKYITSDMNVTEALDALDDAITNVLPEGTITSITSNDKSITITTGTNTVDLSAEKPVISDSYTAVVFPTVDGETYPKGATPVAAKDSLDTVAQKLDTSISAITQEVINNEKVTSEALSKHNESCGFDDNGNYTGATSDKHYIGSSTDLTDAVEILDGVAYDIESSNIFVSGDTIIQNVEDSIDGLLILTSAVTRMNESIGFTENIRYNPQSELISSYTKLSTAVDAIADIVKDLKTRVDKLDGGGS